MKPAHPTIMTPQAAGNSLEEINAASLAYCAGNITTGFNFRRPAGRAGSPGETPASTRSRAAVLRPLAKAVLRGDLESMIYLA